MKILRKMRRIANKTDYLKRKRFLESKKPRIILRKTNRQIILQYVESKIAQDFVKYGVSSSALLEYGWPKEKSGSLKSLGACYLTGLLFGKKIAKEKEAVIDTGLIRNTKGSKLHAAIKGIADSGFKISSNPEMYPEEKRINSDNLKSFFESVRNKIMNEGK